MGAYTCEYGIVHKVCRCPTPHTIKCDVPDEHAKAAYKPKHRADDPVDTTIPPGTIVSRHAAW